MKDRRGYLLIWLAQGRVVPGRERDALQASGVYPSTWGWSVFVDYLLLGLGLVLLLSGVVSFFAANWSEIGRLGRFLLVDALLLAALGLVWWRGVDAPAGHAGLFAAAVFVGVLLALTGQTYQTGADVHELFAAWAVLITPWAILGRSAPLWVLWIGLANLAAYLYYDSFHGFLGLPLGDREALWLSIGFNTLILLAWELAAARGADWLQGRWVPRILATAAGVPVTFLALDAVFDANPADGWLDIALWLVWMGVGFAVYRHRRLDVYMLAGGLLAVVLMAAAGLTRLLHDRGFDVPALLLIALVVVGLSSIGGRWLIRLANRRAG